MGQAVGGMWAEIRYLADDLRVVEFAVAADEDMAVVEPALVRAEFEANVANGLVSESLDRFDSLQYIVEQERVIVTYGVNKCRRRKAMSPKLPDR